jgi:hypothetical protein
MIDPQEFPPSVIEKLGYYVYLLVHPTTNKVFYVGKGTDNRVFEHLKEAANSSNLNEKLDIIRAITRKRLKVKSVIHRHGLTEKEAFEVESALIDFIGLENLSNRMLGHKADERGQMTIEEIIARYNAPEIEIGEPSILIVVNKRFFRGISEEELYGITRKHWVVSPERHQAKYAFAIYHGIVRQVYEIEKWYRSPSYPRRWAFKGKIAENMQHYVSGSVSKYISPGARNPIKYIHC